MAIAAPHFCMVLIRGYATSERPWFKHAPADACQVSGQTPEILHMSRRIVQYLRHQARKQHLQDQDGWVWEGHAERDICFYNKGDLARLIELKAHWSLQARLA